MKRLLFILVCMLLISNINAEMPNIAINVKNASQLTDDINYSLKAVNNSLYWQGHTGNDGSWLTGISTFNSTYNLWSYNQTTATYNLYNAIWNSTYNATYDTCINNASYLSTYNSTYDGKADYQFTTNNFNGSGNFNTSGYIYVGNGSTNVTISTVADNNSIDIYKKTACTTSTGDTFALRIRQSSSYLVLGGDASYSYIQSFNSKPLSFNPAGNNVLIPFSTTKVGIGTTAPTNKLDIVGDTNTTGNISVGNLIIMKSITIPACSNVNNGSIARNITGIFYCNGTSWTKIILNGDGNITINGNINQTTGNSTINNYYGGMYTTSEIGVTGMLLNSTLQKVNFTTSDSLNGFIFIDNNRALELIDGAGMYRVEWRTEKVGTNNHEYHGYIYINEVQQNKTFDRSIAQVSNSLRMLGFGFIRLNKYDNVTLRLADISGTSTPTVYIKNVNLMRVGN